MINNMKKGDGLSLPKDLAEAKLENFPYDN